MKQTLFAWLASIFSSKKQVQTVGPNSFGVQALGDVVILDKDDNVIFDSNNTEAKKRDYDEEREELYSQIKTQMAAPVVIQTQAELDYEFLKTKLNPNTDLVVMQEERYNGLIRLAFINEEVDLWLDRICSWNGKLFILLEGVKGIGIVRC